MATYADWLTRAKARQPAVHFSCSCAGALHVANTPTLRAKAVPLHELFFCGDCSRLVCERCSDAYVDSFYCPHCMRSFFTSQAADNKNW